MEKMPAGVAELGMVIQHTGYNRCPYSNHEGFEFENFAGFAHFRALLVSILVLISLWSVH
jgi:hypothetical protein